MNGNLMSAKLNNILFFSSTYFAGYPYCPDKDPSFFETLLEEFPELDLLQELKVYYAWTLDIDAPKPFHYRTMFRFWLEHRCSNHRNLGGFSEGREHLC